MKRLVEEGSIAGKQLGKSGMRICKISESDGKIMKLWHSYS